LENALRVVRNVESKNMAMATRRTTPYIYQENNVPYSKPPQPTRLTPQQLEEIKPKGLLLACLQAGVLVIDGKIRVCSDGKIGTT
jgi:hypothetical protein